MGKKRRSRQFKNTSQVIDMEEARKERLQRRRQEREEEIARNEAEQRRRSRRKTALRKRQSWWRLGAFAIAVVLVVLLIISIGNIIALKHQLNDVIAQQEQYEQRKAELEKELKNINDVSNLEEQARSQMGLIKKGETLYVFPEEITDGTTEE